MNIAIKPENISGREAFADKVSLVRAPQVGSVWPCRRAGRRGVGNRPQPLRHARGDPGWTARWPAACDV